MDLLLFCLCLHFIKAHKSSLISKKGLRVSIFYLFNLKLRFFLQNLIHSINLGTSFCNYTLPTLWNQTSHCWPQIFSIGKNFGDFVTKSPKQTHQIFLKVCHLSKKQCQLNFKHFLSLIEKENRNSLKINRNS